MTGNDRVEETIWEYKALILDRDKKSKGPNTWVSSANSFVRVDDGGPAALHEVCEFGNRSSHDVAFRVTKTSGLEFIPDHGVLKPNEKVPLKFSLHQGQKCPDYAEIEILAIRVNEANSRKIEDKWRLVPSNKVSRVRHTVEFKTLKGGSNSSKQASPGPAVPPPAKSPPGMNAVKTEPSVPGEPTALRNFPSNVTAKRPPSRDSQTDRTHNLSEAPSCETFFMSSGLQHFVRAGAERQGRGVEVGHVLRSIPADDVMVSATNTSMRALNVTVLLLALAVLYLSLQVRSLWSRVNGMGDNACEGRFCVWFLCR
ncbi:hypothetical protein HPB47_000819 [Ixodes persulcatus]|uniref:Uncharacterized protein n=1 Tax=Ixodes persulcatus TaxID=34615 RepID=A0AC60PR19_IXOPE|nr:hypothetical protein HPB47_000819 [Ixodes persulcatus]